MWRSGAVQVFISGGVEVWSSGGVEREVEEWWSGGVKKFMCTAVGLSTTLIEYRVFKKIRGAFK